MSSDPSTGGVKPWGRWATSGLAVFAMFAGQMAGLWALTWWFATSLTGLPNFGGDGIAVTLLVIVSTPIQLALLVSFARRTGSDPLAYLGLILPRRSEVVFGVAAVVAMIIGGNIVTWLLGINIVTSFQTDIFSSAGTAGVMPVALLFFAVVVVTPIGEETLFRGFLFRGWQRGPGDAWPVIVSTALLWALIHVQYDWYVTAQIFAFGLLLGWMRWASGSTVLTILLHGLINLEGMLETLVAVKWPT